jgi:hypothetical protein
VRLVDQLVEEMIIQRANFADAEKSFMRSKPKVPGAEDELLSLTSRLDTAADMLADGDLDRAGYQRIRDRVAPRIAELKKATAPSADHSALAQMVASDDKPGYWSRIKVETKREIVRSLFDGVIILPAKGIERDQCLWFVWTDHSRP